MTRPSPSTPKSFPLPWWRIPLCRRNRSGGWWWHLPGGTGILLARASKPEQEAFVGNQSGGRVFLFLSTDDFWRDYRQMEKKGVRFVRQPQKTDYGTVAVFADLYGNLWDLIQYQKPENPADS